LHPHLSTETGQGAITTAEIFAATLPNLPVTTMVETAPVSPWPPPCPCC
jgi:hypothetical protein